VRLWDLKDGRCLRVFEGHADKVKSVAWSPDGSRAFSADDAGGVRIWDLAALLAEGQPALEPGPAVVSAPTQVQYTNAKVLLVGETGTGKTGLSKVLAGRAWEPSDSTVGAWATQVTLPIEDGNDGSDGVEREIWLWDFGGQADQRLIHQLYMDQTALAVLVFDGQKEDIFETLGQWDRDLTRASRQPFTKLLVAGRVDAGGLRVSKSRVEAFAKERGFSGRLFETSAKAGIDCDELKAAICAAIDWDAVPWRTSPLLFKRLKEEIVRLKDEGRVLLSFSELRATLRLRLAGDSEQFSDAELKAVIGLLTGPGVVWELKFGDLVLLQPEIVNAYAQAVIQTMREDQHERGCILEERVLGGKLTYHSSMQRLEGDEERFVLLAMHQILLERGLCLREHTELGPMLIFPSYYRRERPELVDHPAVHVSYQFNGFLDDVYATLVVRLHHTSSFEQDELWRYAADFTTLTGKKLGVKMTRRAEGAGEIEVYFDPSIDGEVKILFSKFVQQHLAEKARDVVRLRHYVCSHCGTPVRNREVAMERLEEWLQARPAGAGLPGGIRHSETDKDAPTILCVRCEKRVPLWDEMEQHFASDETRRKVRELQDQAAIVLDAGSKERTLVGEAIAIASQAGQIAREMTVADKGIDMEIEFNLDPILPSREGVATGRKLYLQLKSGDSHLSRRQRDGAEIFKIPSARHATYWMEQPFPVMLVIRGSDGAIRWMEIREYLRRESDGGKKQVKQIVFSGEPFDVASVRSWRDRELGRARQ
jgi:small GTP-binding protein